jgi:rhodanese-related sulfurtransferase
MLKTKTRLVIMAISIILLLGTYIDTNAAPRLVVKEGTNLDLGTVREGITLRVSFTTTNIGTDEADVDVEVVNLRGCSETSSVHKLAPGESGQLEFIFETLGYGGQRPTRFIEVYYNNPDLSPLVLSVTAEIIPPEPYQVPLGEMMYNFFVLVDLRPSEAFAEEHIVGAINISKGELAKWASNIPKYIMIYLFSEDGIKSDEAAQMLREKGFSECVSLLGGLKEWKQMYGNELLISGPK